MKRNLVIIMILAIFVATVKSQERTLNEVKTKVYALLVGTDERQGEDSAILRKRYQENMKISPIRRRNTTYLYAVNLPDKGWAIVSNEQRYPIIIGYSTESYFDSHPEGQPGAVKLLLEYHMDMIDSLRESPTTFFNRVSSLKSSVLNEELRDGEGQVLLKRNGIENKWNQSSNNGYTTDDCDKVYNKFCPDFYSVSCGRTVVGCTAVAIAQILWYWRWPDFALVRDYINMAGTQYGTERRHYYDWDNILPRMDNNTPMYQVDMIAGLLRDCGFTANTIYTGSGSAADVVKLETALSRFHMHWVYNFNYAWTDVTSLLISEMQAKRPVICQAGKEGTITNIHTFVIDGYNASTGLFHVNFGWGGSANGLWNIGFNGYTVARSFFTELYPDCSFYNQSISDIGQNLILADQDVTLYSLQNVNLGQLVVDSGGHLNISVGETITLGNGFHAKLGSVVKLSPNFNCVTSNTPAPVSMPSHKEIESENILTTASMYVSPNPAKDNINIHCDMPINTVYLYNINGQMVLQTSGTQINISMLPKGLYIIRAIAEEGRILQTKLIHE